MKIRFLLFLFCLALILTSCTRDSKTYEPFDDQGRLIAGYGTPVVDGVIDDVWEKAGVIVPEIKSSTGVQAEGEFRVLWDDYALYILFVVKDPVLNAAGINAYEQDSVEIFLDEANDKALSYRSDDVHYRVNYENRQSVDAGDSFRFFRNRFFKG